MTKPELIKRHVRPAVEAYLNRDANAFFVSAFGEDLAAIVREVAAERRPSRTEERAVEQR